MHYVASLRPLSFLHRMGRARNRPTVELAGVRFHWEGRTSLYQSSVLADAGALVGHPAVQVACVGLPPSLDLPAPPPEPEPARVRRARKMVGG